MFPVTLRTFLDLFRNQRWGNSCAVLVSQVGVAELHTPSHDFHTEYHCDGEGVDVHVQNGASRL